MKAISVVPSLETELNRSNTLFLEEDCCGNCSGNGSCSGKKGNKNN